MVAIDSVERSGKIHVTGLNGNKTFHKVVDNFKPVVFYSSSGDETSEYSDIVTGEPVVKSTCETIDEYRGLLEQLEDSDREIYHKHMTPEIQLIKLLSEKKPMDSNDSPLIWYLDIETTTDATSSAPYWAKTGEGTILMIQIASNDSDTVRIIHSYDWEPEKGDERFEGHTFHRCVNDLEMLELLISWMDEEKPTFIEAHYGRIFDYPFLISRLGHLKGLKYPAKKFSPFGKQKSVKVSTFNGIEYLDLPIGPQMLDFVDIYKYATFGGRVSWSLDYLAKYELGDDVGKIPFTNRGFKSIHEFVKGEYDPNFDKIEDSELKKAYENGDVKLLNKLWLDLFFEYGIEDVILLKKLDAKLNATNLLVGVANIFHCPVETVFGTVAPWMIHLANETLSKNKLLPPRSPHENYSIAGGHVFAKPGYHHDTVIFDYTSLYPFCIMDLNMSVETYVHYDDIPDPLLKKIHNKLIGVEEVKDHWDKDRKVDRYKFPEVFEMRNNCEEEMKKIIDRHGDDIIKALKKHNLAMAPNGAIFKKTEDALIPNLVRNIFESRKEAQKRSRDLKEKIAELKRELDRRTDEEIKKEIESLEKEAEIYDIKSSSLKVLINSLYGMITSNYSSIANSNMGAAITSYGRFNIKAMTEYIKTRTEGPSECVLQDTDSFHLSLSFVPKDLDKPNRTKWIYNYAKEHITPMIKKRSKEISSWFNGNGLLDMDFEGIAPNEIVIAKKRYVCELWYDDRLLDRPKKKIVGIEIKRSSTPDVIKKVMDRVLDMIFDTDEQTVANFLTKFRKKYEELPLFEIAIPSSINNIDKYYKEGDGDLNDRFIYKGATQAAKAVHHHNFIISEFDGFDHISPITSGDKIKILHLRRPFISEVPVNVVAFQDPTFLDGVGLNSDNKNLIDYQKQYEKTFLDPIRSILDTIGWNTDVRQLKNRGVF